MINILKLDIINKNGVINSIIFNEYPTTYRISGPTSYEILETNNTNSEKSATYTASILYGNNSSLIPLETKIKVYDFLNSLSPMEVNAIKIYLLENDEEKLLFDSNFLNFSIDSFSILEGSDNNWEFGIVFNLYKERVING